MPYVAGEEVCSYASQHFSVSFVCVAFVVLVSSSIPRKLSMQVATCSVVPCV